MPPKETMTTIKRRTPFQGQPEKTGELTVGHKDFVILPRPPPRAEALADPAVLRAQPREGAGTEPGAQKGGAADGASTRDPPWLAKRVGVPTSGLAC